MATAKRNLSTYDKNSLPNTKGMRIGLVVSEWNSHITNNLLEGAVGALSDCGIPEASQIIYRVPGSFELIHGAKKLLDHNQVDAVVVLGSVIRGETAHFDFVCQAVSYGIAELNLRQSVPVIFGLLTDDNEQQAIDRSGGKHGNKGTECAVAAIQMAGLKG